MRWRREQKEPDMAVVDPDTRRLSFLEKLSERIAEWREKSACEAQLTSLPAAELKRLVRDAGFNSPRQMLEVNARGFEAADEMSELAAQLGVDIEDVRAHYPEVVRQMEIACCCCDCKTKCDRELDAGTADKTFQSFCPNSAEFKSFIAGE
jgi:hypothetical protein